MTNHQCAMIFRVLSNLYLIINQSMNLPRHKRFVLTNCAPIPQNLTESFYRLTKTFTLPNSSEVDYTFPSIRLLLAGKKIIF